METESCLSKKFTDEPVFALLARDASAPRVILHWVELNLFTQPPEKLEQAFQIAMQMRRDHTIFAARKHEIRERQIAAQNIHFCICKIPMPSETGTCGTCGGLLTI